MANSSAKPNNETKDFVKVLADKAKGRVLAIHIIGPFAGELIHEAVLDTEYGAAAEVVILSVLKALRENNVDFKKKSKFNS